MTQPKESLRLRGQLASRSRKSVDASPEQLDALRVDLAVARLAEAIEDTLADTPVTAEHLAHLHRTLDGGAS